MDRDQLQATIWQAFTRYRGRALDRHLVDEILEAADRYANTEARIRSARLKLLAEVAP